MSSCQAAVGVGAAVAVAASAAVAVGVAASVAVAASAAVGVGVAAAVAVGVGVAASAVGVGVAASAVGVGVAASAAVGVAVAAGVAAAVAVGVAACERAVRVCVVAHWRTAPEEALCVLKLQQGILPAALVRQARAPLWAREAKAARVSDLRQVLFEQLAPHHTHAPTYWREAVCMRNL